MIKQRTIKEPLVIEGVGLQTGKPVRLALRGSPANSGINFVRTDLPNKPLLNVRSIDLDKLARPERRTILALGPLQIQTTEHLMAALFGLGIDNILIELDNIELPGLDGSAKGFVDAIKSSSIVEQNAPKKILKIDKPIKCEGKDSSIEAFPSDDLRISYTLSYENASLGTQSFDIILNEGSFEKEIAPARTFCLEEEAEALLKMGLGKGANYENTLVMAKSGPINNVLRFPDEPVRHKILDLVGDLYLLGFPVSGRIVARKSGHNLNIEFVSKLKRLLQEGSEYGKDRV